MTVACTAKAWRRVAAFRGQGRYGREGRGEKEVERLRANARTGPVVNEAPVGLQPSGLGP